MEEAEYGCYARVRIVGNLASAPALGCPSGKKALDVLQHNLVVVGLHEQRAVLAQLRRSTPSAGRPSFYSREERI
jgi:hypothetical protein